MRCSEFSPAAPCYPEAGTASQLGVFAAGGWRVTGERDQAEAAPQADTGPLREGVKSVVKAADNTLILKVREHLHVSVVLDS